MTAIPTTRPGSGHANDLFHTGAWNIHGPPVHWVESHEGSQVLNLSSTEHIVHILIRMLDASWWNVGFLLIGSRVAYLYWRQTASGAGFGISHAG